MVTELRQSEFKKIQANLGLSSGQMADLIGVSLRTIEYWRSGARSIPDSVFLALKSYQKNMRYDRLQDWHNFVGQLSHDNLLHIAGGILAVEFDVDGDFAIARYDDNNRRLVWFGDGAGATNCPSFWFWDITGLDIGELVCADTSDINQSILSLLAEAERSSMLRFDILSCIDDIIDDEYIF